MEAEKKTVALDRNYQLGKRTITWEISDSEEDSDVKPEPSTAFANHLDVGAQGCSGKQQLEVCMKLVEAKAVPLLTPLTQITACDSSPKTKTKKSLEKNKMAQTKGEEKKESVHKKEEKIKRKKQIAVEKERRKEVAAALKFLRPDQCMKQMTVCVDSGLLEHLSSDILLDVLGSLDCKYCIEPQTIPHSITWKRKVFSGVPGPDGCQEKIAVEREVLAVMQPSDFLRQLFLLMQNASPDGQQAVPDLTHLFPFLSLEEPSTASYSMVVIGLDTYQWYKQHHELPQEAPITGQNKWMEDPTLQLGPEQSMTKHQIEEALVVLQLRGNINVLFLETWQQLAQHVSAMTRAIAQRPYKKHQEKQPFSFCANGKWASGVHIGKDGKGLQEAWLKQIQQLNRVSPAMAAAMAEAYPSPSLLLQAYQKCSTDTDRQLLLSNIRIRTKDNKMKRRIGPDLSRRVYLFMVSTNPELVLDLSA